MRVVGQGGVCCLFVCRGDPSEAADDSDPHDDDMCSLFDLSLIHI